MRLPRLDGSKTEPTLLREGARYECFGDGLCCTDIHAIGPIRLPERARLKLVHDGIVAHDPRDDVHVLVMRAESGSCIFLEEGRCAVHEPLGGLLKPLACKQFPISMTATPEGGRITTEHKCPCRTLGERPLVTEESALPAVTHRGKPQPVVHVGRKVPNKPGETISFAEYRRQEDALMARVGAAKSMEDVQHALSPVIFPTIDGTTWEVLASEFDELDGRTRLENVMRWMADAIAACTRAEGDPAFERKERPTPWRDAFERGIARTQTPQDPLAMFVDFVQDHIWAMHWVDEYAFAQFQTEMATRARLFRQLFEWLCEDGLRPDQAAAEAIMMVELGGTTGWWIEVSRRVMV